MEDTLVLYGQGAAASTYHYLGFAPGYVRVIGFEQEDYAEWCPLIPDEDMVQTVDTDGADSERSLTTDNGIRLVKFDDQPGTVPGSGGTPSDVAIEEWWNANGIEITSGVLPIANGTPYCIVAHRMTVPIIRSVHDGGNNCNTYFQDGSIDFIKAGIGANGKFIVINETNDNYAYIGAITMPYGTTKHCRCYVYEDEYLGTACAAADFDNDDVLFIIPREWAQSPLSGIGLMT